ncbi:hypothetical protein [Nocardiopsis protaetiae]|uniref:hypothetical protein n=1 Tax=Nocardiopsis protaetiae TaxID=3382270 RepID=UPI00387B01D8
MKTRRSVSSLPNPASRAVSATPRPSSSSAAAATSPGGIGRSTRSSPPATTTVSTGPAMSPAAPCTGSGAPMDVVTGAPSGEA